MLRYICKNCDNLQCETSECPVCGGRTELIESSVFYCKKCNVPVFDDECECCRSKCERIGTDIRPVFAQERLLLEVLLNKPFEFADKSIWCAGANNYIVNGNRIRFSFREMAKQDSQKIINKLKKHEDNNSKYVGDDINNKFINKFITFIRSPIE